MPRRYLRSSRFCSALLPTTGTTRRVAPSSIRLARSSAILTELPAVPVVSISTTPRLTVADCWAIAGVTTPTIAKSPSKLTVDSIREVMAVAGPFQRRRFATGLPLLLYPTHERVGTNGSRPRCRRGLHSDAPALGTPDHRTRPSVTPPVRRRHRRRVRKRAVPTQHRLWQ